MRRLVVASVVALLLPTVAADATRSVSARQRPRDNRRQTLLQPFDTIKPAADEQQRDLGETARGGEGGPLALYRGYRSRCPSPFSMADFGASAAKRALLEGAPSVPRLLLVAVAAALGNFVASGGACPAR